jgi:hypothetical protein
LWKIKSKLLFLLLFMPTKILRITPKELKITPVPINLKMGGGYSI